MERELFRFDAPEAIAGWSAVDDRVMGGCSQSALRQAGAGLALFSGQVWLAQGGGFASVRSAPQDLGAPGARAYAFDVRGDGKRYKLALRTDDAFDGISWQATFVAPVAEFATIRLPVSAFVASYRGRAVAAAPPLDPARVRQVGLVIADGQSGPFGLELRMIRAE
jgi:NADH dehydrogenase [ubiquinone] 1 alpha subcomplex assembly factor 1